MIKICLQNLQNKSSQRDSPMNLTEIQKEKTKLIEQAFSGDESAEAFCFRTARWFDLRDMEQEADKNKLKHLLAILRNYF